MSKHRDDCCCQGGFSMGGYGYGGGYGAAGYGVGGGSGYNFNRWIYALLILIVIVLQFGRNRNKCENNLTGVCEDGNLGISGSTCKDGQLIDNSVLFIIIVFLLIICAGCWGSSGCGGGAGFAGGYGY
jgi:hypothetical protein